jgi:protein O-GlcNAcase/histone acetyltransferase
LDFAAESKFETEGVEDEEDLSNLPSDVYHPRRALKNALKDWAAEFAIPKVSSASIVTAPGAVTVSVGSIIGVPLPGIPPISLSLPVPISVTPTGDGVSVEASQVVPVVPVSVPVPASVHPSVHVNPPVAVPTKEVPAETTDRWPTPSLPRVALPPVTPALPLASEPTPVQVDVSCTI